MTTCSCCCCCCCVWCPSYCSDLLPGLSPRNFFTTFLRECHFRRVCVREHHFFYFLPIEPCPEAIMCCLTRLEALNFGTMFAGSLVHEPKHHWPWNFPVQTQEGRKVGEIAALALTHFKKRSESNNAACLMFILLFCVMNAPEHHRIWHCRLLTGPILSTFRRTRIRKRCALSAGTTPKDG